MKSVFISGLYLFSVLTLCAQPQFPEDGSLFSLADVKEISVTVDADSLALMIAELDKYNPLMASVEIESEGNEVTIDQVGFRLRGNTSLQAPKKSWKLDFNAFLPGQKFMGLEKLNLRGMHNDPSIMRSKLCLDLFRFLDVPAPRASFTDLRINGSNYGVFCLEEHIDEEFVASRFGNKDGNLFKCTWPSDLTWQGSNPNNYSSYGYELKTNEDVNNISDLIDFIYILNTSTDLECELEEVFNVNSYLKSMAIDIFTGNWDGPIYNKNNFYLYHNTATGQFEYIPYDLDNTWGIDWINIDWGNRNIYSWHNSSEPRPLFTQIIGIPTYRDRFSEYMARIITAVDNNDYIDNINDVALMLAGKVNQDPYYPLTYGYTFSDFLLSITSPIPGGSFHDDAYGLISFIEERALTGETQLDQTWNFSPAISYFDVEDGYADSDFIFTVQIEDDMTGTEVWLESEIHTDASTYSQDIELKDDGIGADTLAMDGIFSAMLSSDMITLINGKIRAVDAEGNLSFYPCEKEYIRDIAIGTHQLYINEFMASNTSVLADEAGEYDDWIELHNGGEFDLYIGNYFLTDNFEIPNKWKLPNITIPAGGHYIIWADKDEEQGENHANFKLEAESEEIAIFEPIIDRYKPVDLVRYTNALEDVSYGYLPDASQPVVEQVFATPGTANGEEVDSSIIDELPTEFSVYPNPSNGIIFIDKEDISQVEVFDINLKLVRASDSPALDISDFINGIYLLRVIDSNNNISPFQKIIKN